VVNTMIESGVPEVSLDGVTGITVPPMDSKALARAVRMLLENDEMRAKYGRAAAARAEEAFTVERMGKTSLGYMRRSRRNFPHYCTSKNGNGFLTKGGLPSTKRQSPAKPKFSNRNRD